MLAAHCENWARFVAAVKQYRAEGLTKINPHSGRTAKRPAIVAASEAAPALVKAARQLGLSPVSERRLGTFTQSSDEDPFAG